MIEADDDLRVRIQATAGSGSVNEERIATATGKELDELAADYDMDRRSDGSTGGIHPHTLEALANLHPTREEFEAVLQSLVRAHGKVDAVIEAAGLSVDPDEKSVAEQIASLTNQLAEVTTKLAALQQSLRGITH